MAEPADGQVPRPLSDLGHLCSGVGHHVINALSAIVSSAELLRIATGPTPMPGGAIPGEQAALLDTIVDAALNASSVARRMIDFSRPITTTGTGRLSLDALVAEVVAQQAALHPEIAWTTAIRPLPEIQGRAPHLQSMFEHILTNCYEALPPSGGSIAVTAELDARGWILVSIRDSGKGMSPETLAHAVEPFFTDKAGHFGVGLTLANGIWRRHHGSLSLQSQPGEGTLVRLSLDPHCEWLGLMGGVGRELLTSPPPGSAGDADSGSGDREGDLDDGPVVGPSQAELTTDPA